MFCEKCGNKLIDNSKFCGNCGELINTTEINTKINTKISDENQINKSMHKNNVEQNTASPKRKKSKKSKKKSRIISIFILILLTISGATYYYFTSPMDDIIKLINNEDYIDAVELYNDDIGETWIEQEIYEMIFRNAIKSVTNKYDSIEMEFEELQEALNILALSKNIEIANLAIENLELATEMNISRNMAKEAEEEYIDGNYLEAIDKYEQVSETSDQYETAVQRITEAREKYKEEVMMQTLNPENQQDYANSISLVDTALSVLPEDQELLERKSHLESEYNEIVKAETLSNVGEFLKNSDYESAFELINKSLKVLPEDSDLTNLLSSTEETYIAHIVNKAEELKTLGQFDEALVVLDGALRILPDQSTFIDLRAMVIDLKPVKLSEFTISESNDVELIEDRVVLKDTIGNSYNPGNLYYFNAYSSESYMKVYLGKEYSRLIFTIAVSEDQPNDINKVSFNVMNGDATLLYSAENIGRDTAPIFVELDVSGQEWLYLSRAKGAYKGVNLLIAEPLLYK